MAEKETHDQNQAAVDLKRLEVLGKVYSLLNKPIQKSAVLTFEPISFKQVHRIVDIASYKIIDSHNRSMPMIAAMEKIGKHHQSERVNTATFKNRLSAQAEMDDHDQSSFFVPDVDIGTNILFTYFLHAVEIERLVRINQELAKDCKELDEEAGTLQSKTDSLEAALKKSEDDRAVVSGRYATLQANYANQTQLEQELREEIRKLQGAIANNKMAHEKEIAELKKASVVQAKEHGASGNRKTSEYRSEEETAPQNNQKRDQQKQNPDELTRLISQNEALKADIRKLKDQSAPSPDPVSHKDSFLSKLRAIDQGIHKSERLIKEYSSSRAPPPASSAEVPPPQKISQLIMGGTGDKKSRTATVPAGDCAEDGFVERQMFAHHFTIDKAVLRHDYDRRPVAGPPVQLYPAPLDSGRAGAKQPGSRQPFEAPGPKSERNCSAKSAAGETNPYQRQAFLPGLSTDRERLSTQEAGQALYRPILHSSSKKKASKPQSVATGLHCDNASAISRDEFPQNGMFRSTHLGRPAPRLDRPKEARELGPVVDFEAEEAGADVLSSNLEQPRFSFKAHRSEFRSGHSIAGKQLPHRNFLHSHKPHWPKGPGQAKVPGLIAKFMESRVPEAQLAACPALEAVPATPARRAAD